MLIMLIMLIKKVAQSCRLGNKAEFVHKPIGNMNQSKNLTLLTISRFSGRQLDYSVLRLKAYFTGNISLSGVIQVLIKHRMSTAVDISPYSAGIDF